MPTGACGVNCDVCKLNLKGVCSTCGPGNSDTAAAKAAAQQRILGAPCPILACARLNNIRHCMADCDMFPCDNFRSGPYPFSEGFLNMQQRRRDDTPAAYAPDGSHLKVADEYWQGAAERDEVTLCNLTFFESVGQGVFQFSFLNETVRIDLGKRTLLRREDDEQWYPAKDPLLTLVSVLYMKNVQTVFAMGADIVSAKELKEGHFFTGPHLFRTDPLLERYGRDLDGFRMACKRLQGNVLDMADAAYRLLPFPRLPIYMLLWAGDDEFQPRLRVLFDRPIETILSADAIWALVNRVAMAFGNV